ncbi:ATP-binding protein [Streptomyces naphthomycinicus]|uniref:ATP-binding protein n=1 Tax=Streptomyces naphthomycinicus TaxID=2872625 RepID=UPI001CEDA53F|nr:helix-turn-helix domain-containing protein [Streptomyces sp. TML10]
MDREAAEPVAEGFGPLLVALRRRAGMSQERLAHTAGVSVRALADLERGRSRGPQRRTVQALAAGMGLDEETAAELERAARLGRPRPRPGTGPRAHSLLALPRDIGDFVARETALAGLIALVEGVAPACSPVSVVSGQPGLGKSAFAVHAAYRLAPHFPDGQLALDLHGMDPEPTTARDALGSLLRAVGVAEHALPVSVEDRSGLLRSVVRDRRLLLVLDNAASEDQVRPLLPGAGRCLTIVTSRHSLAGLEAVHRTDLALLRREEAVELLSRIIGPERVRQEAQAARDLAELCGFLPLAVRIAGQRLAGRPHERIGKLAARLAREERRLDTLQVGDLQVRAAFALSYRQLTPAARTVLRRASLAAGGDFSPESAALLAGLPVDRGARYAEELTDAGLLQPDATAERYRFHDLVKLFAGEQLAAEDGDAVSRAALDRTAQWMLRRATAAALRFDADRHQDTPNDDPDPAGAPADRDEARAWLEAERAQWLAALHHAQAAGHHRQVIDTAGAMHWFSDLNQHWELWVEVFRCGVEAARALGSRPDEAVQLNFLAWSYNNCVHDHRAALATADAALAVARETGSRLQTGWALGYGASALSRVGRVEEAIARLRESAACLADETSTQGRLAELSMLNILGSHLRRSGGAEEALAIHRRSEAICRAQVPGAPAELVTIYLAAARQHIGNDYAALERWAEAELPLRQALAIFESVNMASWAESARLDLGIVLRRLARYDEARRALLDAHDALRELNSPRQAEAEAELRELRVRAG